MIDAHKTRYKDTIFLDRGGYHNSDLIPIYTIGSDNNSSTINGRNDVKKFLPMPFISYLHSSIHVPVLTTVVSSAKRSSEGILNKVISKKYHHKFIFCPKRSAKSFLDEVTLPWTKPRISLTY